MRECSGKHRGFDVARTVLASTLAVFGYVSSGPNQATAEPTVERHRVVEPMPGKTVTVARFDTHGAMLARYGDYDLGGGLAAQLASELEGSGQFIVVKRAEFPNSMHELELALSGLTPAQTSPQAARLLGAQFLVRGSVTGVDETDGDNGSRIGAPGSSASGGALSTDSRPGHVSIDLRVFDTTTGRVVASFTVARELGRTSRSIDGVSQSGARLGNDAFQRSALGRATHEAIAEAALEMGRELDDAPWNAQVTKVRAGQVYLNAGANADLHEGERLDVYRMVAHIEHPDTGAVLGAEERHIGTVTLGSVQPCYATGTFSGANGPRVGDNLR